MFDKRRIGDNMSIYIGKNFLLSATVGKKGDIKISKSSEIGSDLIKAIVGKKKKIRALG
jgi:predicted PilT family ATPase